MELFKNNPDTSFPEYRDFAMHPKFADDINKLATLAMPEDWDNSGGNSQNNILKNYFFYTYARVSEEKKIVIDDEVSYACWNIGLMTDNFEQIFAFYTKNRMSDSPQYWHFSRFCRESDPELSNFKLLPDPATYYSDVSQLVFESSKPLRINYEHIAEENYPRIPESLKCVGKFAVQNILRGAIALAVERASRNYKYVVPQFYNGRVQLLLPLALVSPGKADLALVLDDNGDFYRASTCLTLDMAYGNARLIAKPDKEWLIP